MRHSSLHVDAIGDQAGPASLVRGAETHTFVAVKVFVEQYEVAERRIARVLFRQSPIRSVARAKAALLVREKNAREAARQLIGHFAEAHEPTGSGRTFCLERIAKVVVI